MSWEAISAIGTAASAVAGIIAAYFYYVVAKRARQFSKEMLSVYIGVTETFSSDAISTEHRHVPVHSIVYLVNRPIDNGLFVCLPFGIGNTGSKPITNVTVRLNYPLRFFIPEELRKSRAVKPSSEEGISTHQEIQVLGPTVSLINTIAVLRPGEHINFIEYLNFSPLPINKREYLEDVNSDYTVLLDYVRKIANIQDLGVAFIDVTSNETTPITRKAYFSLFCFTEKVGLSKPEDIMDITNKIYHDLASAFWFGNIPDAGGYLGLPSGTLKEALRTVRGEVTVPQLGGAKLSDGKLYYVQKIVRSPGSSFEMKVPNVRHSKIPEKFRSGNSLLMVLLYGLPLAELILKNTDNAACEIN